MPTRILTMLDEADDTTWPEAIDWASPHGWRTAGRDPDWLDQHADIPTTFWLGTHAVTWAWSGELAGPAFISATRLRGRKSPWPRARVPVAIDSGGFTQITKHGGWDLVPARDYVALVRRVSAEMGTVAWAAIQDWMVEDVALRATGLTVLEHQRRTVASYLELVGLAPEVRWLPVLQGQTVADYLHCWDLYDQAGVDLIGHQLVGLGSVCRRQAAAEIVQVVGGLAGRGIRIHGFGVKATGLELVQGLLDSADSLAWAKDGMHATRSRGLRDSQGRNLANSPEQAIAFRRKMLALIAREGVWISGSQLPFEI